MNAWRVILFPHGWATSAAGIRLSLEHTDYINLVFGTECYLKSISNFKASTHDLKIERGRYVRPKLNVDERLCLSCNVVENEEYFVTVCKDNEVERALFTNKLEKRDPSFANLTNREKVIFLLTCADSQILTWFGKCIYHSFLNRNMLKHNMRK